MLHRSNMHNIGIAEEYVKFFCALQQKNYSL